MDPNRPHFTPDGVRWSCRDVNGVTPNTNTSDDRGQEYCEYFTMLHTDGIPAIISDASGPVANKTGFSGATSSSSLRVG